MIEWLRGAAYKRLKFPNRLQECISGAGPGHVKSRFVRHRVAAFAVLCLLPGAFLGPELYRLFGLVLNDGNYSHIPLIPVISVYFLYVWRDLIFKRVGQAWKSGSALIFSGAVSLTAARVNAFNLIATNQNSLLIFGLVLLWIGMFLLCFGLSPFRVALFPLLFLFFMVPIPEPLLTHIVVFLQEYSSDCAAWMFQLMGVPFLRHGFDFALPSVTIRVAEECSGIRSTLALVIVSVLTSKLFLKNTWHRLILCLFVIPISIAKNGFRIAFLSTMAIYVNPSFLTGPLHHRGGIVFFVIGLLPFFLILKLLQSREGERAVLPSNSGAPA